MLSPDEALWLGEVSEDFQLVATMMAIMSKLIASHYCSWIRLDWVLSSVSSAIWPPAKVKGSFHPHLPRGNPIPCKVCDFVLNTWTLHTSRTITDRHVVVRPEDAERF